MLRGFCKNGEPGEAGTRGIDPIVQMRKVRPRQGHGQMGLLPQRSYR